MPRILRPHDWQVTGSRPVFAIDRRDVPGSLLLNIAPWSEYTAASLQAPLRACLEVPEAEHSMARFRVPRSLPDGQYVAYLTRHGEDPPRILAASGFFVTDRFRGIRFPLADMRSERAFGVLMGPPDMVPIPMEVRDDPGLARRVHIVLPSLQRRRLSGGPNTALALGQVLAARGIGVNFISCDEPVEPDRGVLHHHLALLTGIATTSAPVTFADGTDADRPVTIGASDLMLGTAWRTVQKFRHCLRELRCPRFIYLIQEYEPAFYPLSTHHALAMETYAMDHLAIYNHRFLRDFFRGRGLDDGDGSWFDPVIDTRHFHYDPSAHDRDTRTLLFYARPTVAARNLYEIGCAALAEVAGEGAFDEGWSLHSMGEKVGDIYLPRDRVVEELPWMDFDEYAKWMRSCDLLVSLMLSPHPSYPPLEAAASGALVVTTAFANKTRERMERLSANLISTAPTLDGITAGIREAIARLVDVDARRHASALFLPADWPAALSRVADRIVEFWARTGE